jgi:uncharacterized protein YukE
MDREKIIDEIMKLQTVFTREAYDKHSDEYLELYLEQRKIEKEIYDTQNDIRQIEKDLETKQRRLIELKYDMGKTVGKFSMMKDESNCQ